MPKRKKNSTRRLLLIIGILAVVLITVAVVGATTGLFGGKNKGTRVETASVEERDITQVVTASGKVQPEVEVKISPDVSGEIVFLGVREGDEVEQGQLLVRIKPDFYTAQLEQATARVSQARASESQARANQLQADLDVKRKKELFDKNVIPESEYETASTQYQVAQANLESAQFAVQSAQAAEREAREQLNKTSIYAPMSGTISQLNVEVGERVVGTTQMAGTELMRVARLNQMEMEVDVNENDVVNVSLGDSASIEVDAYPERSFKGVVTEIANSATVTGAGTQEQVTNFSVKIRILDPHNLDAESSTAPDVREGELAAGEVNIVPQFRPGMSGTVDVYTATVMRVAAVPIQAVTVRDFNQLKKDGDGNGDEESEPSEPAENETDSGSSLPQKEDLRKVVFIAADNGKAEMAEVETGIADDTHIEIKTGLEIGKKVIVGPYSAVSRSLKPESTITTDTPERRGGSSEGNE